jgi:hypothetical protein
MSSRRWLGVKVLLAAFVLGAVMLFAGVIFQRVGPVPPPATVVAEPEGSFNFHVTAYVQRRAVRWAVAVPLLSTALFGVILLLLPVNETDRT